MMPTVPSAPAAIELLEPSESGRCYAMAGTVRLSDVDRNGQMRLDSTARFLQDVATEDANDARLDRRFGWLVRRTLIVTTTPAIVGESFEIFTWCTGVGRSWAERRSRIVGARGARVDAVSLWVQVDIATGRPARIADDFTAAYSGSAAGRTVSARLRLPSPEQRAQRLGGWAVRRTDLDPFGHVNNAATWSFLEEAAELDERERRGTAEMEYLRPVERVDGESADQIQLVVEHQGAHTNAWLVADMQTLAAARWSPSVP